MLPADGIGSHETIGQVKPKVKGIYWHLARDHLKWRKYYNEDMLTESFKGIAQKKTLAWANIVGKT